MGTRIEELDSLVTGDFTVREVLAIVDEQDTAVALQFVFTDGSSLVCTAWTDWSLRADKRADAQIPDYFWPVSDYSQTPAGIDIPAEGAAIESVAAADDETGTLIGADFRIAGHRVSVKSVAGEIELSIRGV
ncbi:hypothetical protein [Streptomyces sp. NPDC049881]|uniref:hypothetical protein n=1 Tax=Streptomyces sp. NPDC049881 TaxID=3155778 RepID=UPI00344A4AA2